jgi:hypothetical protein
MASSGGRVGVLPILAAIASVAAVVAATFSDFRTDHVAQPRGDGTAHTLPATSDMAPAIATEEPVDEATGSPQTSNDIARAPMPPSASVTSEQASVFVNTKGVVLGRTGVRAEQVALSVTDASGTIVHHTEVTTDSEGRYEVDMGTHDGRTRRIHGGSTLNVSRAGQTTRVPVTLAGLLDEQTGALTGTAPPGATITASLQPHGSRPGALETLTTVAAPDGSFRLGFAHSQGSPAHPFRGHQADVWAEVEEDVYLFRVIQTPNLTLERSRRHAGGAYLLPGDDITFELHRGSSVVETAAGRADLDGIAQVRFDQLQPGDVLGMRYHDAGGDERVLRLLPLQLEVAIALGDGAVTGATVPGRAVVALLEDPTTRVPRRLRTRANAAGAFAFDFGAFTGGELLMVWAVADEGDFGIGVLRSHQRIPAVPTVSEQAAPAPAGAPGVP